MAKKRLLTEFGMGSSLRRQDYTQAAVRAVTNALWHNSINLAELFDRPKKRALLSRYKGSSLLFHYLILSSGFLPVRQLTSTSSKHCDSALIEHSPSGPA